jgi:hypothetical protein
MKVGIMQPYFFPYIGHFQLITATDQWIVFDTPQYIRHGWINRNRILKPDRNEWQYISVPLNKHSREATIKSVEISDTEDWRGKIIGQLNHYKKKSPYYSDTLNIISESINIKTKSIVELNTNALKNICNYLNIPFHYKIYSEMGLSHETPKHAGEWALIISKSIGAKTYINPSGGIELFDNTEFEKSDIELLFIESQIIEYQQHNTNFIPGLSIIDLMMFNSASSIREMLTKYNLVKGA